MLLPSAQREAARTHSAMVSQGVPVVAVLPFQDLTGLGPGGDLGKGIAEAFIADLGTFPDFEVVSSTSSFAYATKSVPEIVEQTGAVFIVEGSVRRSGGKGFVTMKLIRGDTDRQVKVVQVEEPLSDPVQFQSKVAERLRDELGGVTGDLRQEYGRIALEKPVDQRTEYDFYALGHLSSLRGKHDEADRIWQDGLTRFPGSSLLRYKLMIYRLLPLNDVEAAAKLWGEAEKHPRRSRLDDWYRHWMGAWLHSYRGEHLLAVTEARAAVAMSPFDVDCYKGLSWVMREAGEIDEALEWAIFSVTHNPHVNRGSLRTLKDAYRVTGKWQNAVALAEKQIANDPAHAKFWYEFLDIAYSNTETGREVTGRLEKGYGAAGAAGLMRSCPEFFHQQIAPRTASSTGVRHHRCERA